MIDKLKVLMVVVLVSIGLSFAACRRSKDVNPIVPVQGFVAAGEPIEGADLKVYGSDGKDISSDSIRTYKTGHYFTKISKGRADFRVVAQNGIFEGKRFSGKLESEVRGYDPAEEIRLIYLNPATTLFSRYLQKHRGMDVKQASERTKKYLQIPDYIDIGRGLQGPNPYFNTRAFLAEAGAHGGIDAFFAIMLEEMDRDPNSVHSFASIGGNPAGDESGASLAKWAAGKLGGPLANMAFSMLMDNLGLSKDSKIMRDLAEIKAKLEVISQQLSQIKDLVLRQGQELRCSQDAWGYDAKINSLMPLINWAETYITIFDSIAKMDPQNQEAVSFNKKQLMDAIGQKLSIHKDIHDLVCGNQTMGTKGAVWIYSQLMSKCGGPGQQQLAFLNESNSKKLVNQYNMMALASVASCSLMVNYYVAAKNPIMAEVAAKECRTIMDDIYKWRVDPVPEGKNIFVDLRTLDRAWQVLDTAGTADHCSSSCSEFPMMGQLRLCSCKDAYLSASTNSMIKSGRAIMPTEPAIQDLLAGCAGGNPSEVSACLERNGASNSNGSLFGRNPADVSFWVDPYRSKRERYTPYDSAGNGGRCIDLPNRDRWFFQNNPSCGLKYVVKYDGSMSPVSGSLGQTYKVVAPAWVPRWSMPFWETTNVTAMRHPVPDGAENCKIGDSEKECRARP